ncbi:MAG: peptide chain release factor N(5)-glutamine methyltransferase [Alistipes sp.]|nr:peptide chain release factor N(5)-glutamine methyltransferase [Alistipes sp.]
MTVREAIRTIEQAVQTIYDEREATAIARQVVCNRCGYSFSELVVHYDDECQIDDFQTIIDRLSAACPVQYVLGEAEFCDLTFEVRSGVLIPRPETEELVARVVADSRAGVRILDVGTGSGAIAVSLAKMVEGAEVVAVDISDIALEIAARNAERNGVKVEFVKADALADMSYLGQFDIIVSNPPYIPQSDLATMNRNVVDFEPHTALFVADDDALCFYRSIAQNGLTMLRTGGRLYFEIYEQFGSQIADMLRQMGYSDVVVAKDIFDKERMVWSRR